MNAELLQEIIKKHGLWIESKTGGERANLRCADLRDADLRCADLRCADLRDADLRCADLRDADLRCADLRCADLSGADLRCANLRDANLRDADLRGADLRCADLRDANLRDADLSGADLRCADLRGADLSGAKNLISNINFLEAHFERTEKGYIAYKTFNSQYAAPKEWDIKPGAIIKENVNFTRTQDCGCGINVAPLEWVKRNVNGEIWRVLIRLEWLAGICCPYNSDGKIRCERVELLEVVK